MKKDWIMKQQKWKKKYQQGSELLDVARCNDGVVIIYANCDDRLRFFSLPRLMMTHWKPSNLHIDRWENVKWFNNTAEHVYGCDVTWSRTLAPWRDSSFSKSASNEFPLLIHSLIRILIWTHRRLFHFSIRLCSPRRSPNRIEVRCMKPWWWCSAYLLFMALWDDNFFLFINFQDRMTRMLWLTSQLTLHITTLNDVTRRFSFSFVSCISGDSNQLA